MSELKDRDLLFAHDNWNYLFGRPGGSGLIRSQPEDFKVDEELGFELQGEGDHLWFNLSKRLLNTAEVLTLISKATGVSKRDIGYSGQKDRNAVTTQWFSAPLDNQPAARIDQLRNLTDGCQELELMQSGLHPTKLKRGVHRANRFRILIRNLSGDQQDLESRLRRLAQEGVPNYFGPQRFGRQGNNLRTGARLFSGEIGKLDRIAKGMALSAARSWIFNQVLSDRLGSWNWNDPVLGDAMQLDGNNAFFVHDGSDPSVVDRIQRHDLHITGPMWGRGEIPTRGTVAEFEIESVRKIRLLPDGLERFGLHQQRRALRVLPRNLSWQLKKGHECCLEFSLGRGSFATALLREIVDYSD
ncbi:MAG: tRNA pseudouridine(13) synthase TruD [bacterium]